MRSTFDHQGNTYSSHDGFYYCDDAMIPQYDYAYKLNEYLYENYERLVEEDESYIRFYIDNVQSYCVYYIDINFRYKRYENVSRKGITKWTSDKNLDTIKIYRGLDSAKKSIKYKYLNNKNKDIIYNYEEL